MLALIRPVITSTLGRWVARDQVDAGRAGLLGQARDQLLDLLADHHHQVGQLVDDDDDVRQALQRLGLLGREAEGVGNGFLARLGLVDLGVVARQIAHAQLAHELVAALHLGHAPVQAIGGLLHVGDHGAQQVRNAFVDRHFQHLGIDHQQAHIAGLGLVQQRQDHGVDPHRLARTRGAGHQHVRHLGQIGHDRIAHDVLAQTHGQHALGVVVDLRAQHLGQADGLALGIGQLQRHEILAGNRLDHADGHQGQRARQILGQVHDLRALDARGRLDLVARDHGAGHGGDHMHIDTKVLEALFDQPAGHLQRFGRDAFLALLRRIEQIHLGQLAVGQFGEQGLLALLDHAHAGYRSLLEHGFDDLHGLRVLHGAFRALFLHHFLALARSAAACGFVPGLFTARKKKEHPAVQACAHGFGQMTPGKAEYHGKADHGHADADQARAHEAQPLQAVVPQHVTEDAAGRAGQNALEAVQARPLQCAARTQQQQQPAPKAQAPAPQGRQWHTVARHAAAQPARKGRQPGLQRGQHQPPDRHAETEIAGVGQPGSDAAHPVGDQARVSRPGGGPRWILGRVAEHGGKPEHQGQQPRQQQHFVAEARHHAGARRRPGFALGGCGSVQSVQ